jgi:hypothetical protein
MHPLNKNFTSLKLLGAPPHREDVTVRRLRATGTLKRNFRKLDVSIYATHLDPLVAADICNLFSVKVVFFAIRRNEGGDRGDHRI